MRLLALLTVALDLGCVCCDTRRVTAKAHFRSPHSYRLTSALATSNVTAVQLPNGETVLHRRMEAAVAVRVAPTASVSPPQPFRRSERPAIVGMQHASSTMLCMHAIAAFELCKCLLIGGAGRNGREGSGKGNIARRLASLLLLGQDYTNAKGSDRTTLKHASQLGPGDWQETYAHARAPRRVSRVLRSCGTRERSSCRPLPRSYS